MVTWREPSLCGDRSKYTYAEIRAVPLPAVIDIGLSPSHSRAFQSHLMHAKTRRPPELLVNSADSKFQHQSDSHRPLRMRVQALYRVGSPSDPCVQQELRWTDKQRACPSSLHAHAKKLVRRPGKVNEMTVRYVLDLHSV